MADISKLGKRSNGRRSSILKRALADIDVNFKEKKENERRSSKRVSFAETFHVKEFPRDSPGVSEAEESKLASISRASTLVPGSNEPVLQDQNVPKILDSKGNTGSSSILDDWETTFISGMSDPGSYLESTRNSDRFDSYALSDTDLDVSHITQDETSVFLSTIIPTPVMHSPLTSTLGMKPADLQSNQPWPVTAESVYPASEGYDTGEDLQRTENKTVVFNEQEGDSMDLTVMDMSREVVMQPAPKMKFQDFIGKLKAGANSHVVGMHRVKEEQTVFFRDTDRDGQTMEFTQNLSQHNTNAFYTTFRSVVSPSSKMLASKTKTNLYGNMTGPVGVNNTRNLPINRSSSNENVMTAKSFLVSLYTDKPPESATTESSLPLSWAQENQEEDNDMTMSMEMTGCLDATTRAFLDSSDSADCTGNCQPTSSQTCVAQRVQDCCPVLLDNCHEETMELTGYIESTRELLIEANSSDVVATSVPVQANNSRSLPRKTLNDTTSLPRHAFVPEGPTGTNQSPTAFTPVTPAVDQNNMTTVTAAEKYLKLTPTNSVFKSGKCCDSDPQNRNATSVGNTVITTEPNKRKETIPVVMQLKKKRAALLPIEQGGDVPPVRMTAMHVEQGGDVPPVRMTAMPVEQGGDVPPVRMTAMHVEQGGDVPPVRMTAMHVEQGGDVPPVRMTAMHVESSKFSAVIPDKQENRRTLTTVTVMPLGKKVVMLPAEPYKTVAVTDNIAILGDGEQRETEWRKRAAANRITTESEEQDERATTASLRYGDRTPTTTASLRYGDRTPTAAAFEDGNRETLVRTPATTVVFEHSHRETRDRIPATTAVFEHSRRETLDRTSTTTAVFEHSRRETLDRTPATTAAFEHSHRETHDRTPTTTAAFEHSHRETHDRTPTTTASLRYGDRETPARTPTTAAFEDGNRETLVRTPATTVVFEHSRRETLDRTPTVMEANQRAKSVDDGKRTSTTFTTEQQDIGTLVVTRPNNIAQLLLDQEKTSLMSKPVIIRQKGSRTALLPLWQDSRAATSNAHSVDTSVVQPTSRFFSEGSFNQTLHFVENETGAVMEITDAFTDIAADDVPVASGFAANSHTVDACDVRPRIQPFLEGSLNQTLQFAGNETGAVMELIDTFTDSADDVPTTSALAASSHAVNTCVVRPTKRSFLEDCLNHTVQFAENETGALMEITDPFSDRADDEFNTNVTSKRRVLAKLTTANTHCSTSAFSLAQDRTRIFNGEETTNQMNFTCQSPRPLANVELDISSSKPLGHSLYKHFTCVTSNKIQIDEPQDHDALQEKHGAPLEEYVEKASKSTASSFAIGKKILAASRHCTPPSDTLSSEKSNLPDAYIASASENMHLLHSSPLPSSNHVKEVFANESTINALDKAADVNLNMKDDVNLDMKDDVSLDMKADVNLDMNADVNLDMKDDVNLDMNADVNLDMKDDVNLDMKADVNRDMKDDVNLDMKDDVNLDMKDDVNLDMKADVNLDMKDDVNLDMKDDVNLDMKADANLNCTNIVLARREDQSLAEKSKIFRPEETASNMSLTCVSVTRAHPRISSTTALSFDPSSQPSDKTILFSADGTAANMSLTGSSCQITQALPASESDQIPHSEEDRLMSVKLCPIHALGNDKFVTYHSEQPLNKIDGDCAVFTSQSAGSEKFSSDEEQVITPTYRAEAVMTLRRPQSTKLPLYKDTRGTTVSVNEAPSTSVSPLTNDGVWNKQSLVDKAEDNKWTLNSRVDFTGVLAQLKKKLMENSSLRDTDNTGYKTVQIMDTVKRLPVEEQQLSVRNVRGGASRKLVLSPAAGSAKKAATLSHNSCLTQKLQCEESKQLRSSPKKHFLGSDLLNDGPVVKHLRLSSQTSVDSHSGGELSPEQDKYDTDISMKPSHTQSPSGLPVKACNSETKQNSFSWPRNASTAAVKSSSVLGTPTSESVSEMSFVKSVVDSEGIKGLPVRFLSACDQLGIEQFQLLGWKGRRSSGLVKPEIPCDTVADRLNLMSIIQPECEHKAEFFKKTATILQRESAYSEDLEEKALQQITQLNLVTRAEQCKSVKQQICRLLNVGKKETQAEWKTHKADMLNSLVQDIKARKEAVVQDLNNMLSGAEHMATLLENVNLKTEQLQNELCSVQNQLAAKKHSDRYLQKRQHVQERCTELKLLQERVSEEQSTTKQLQQRMSDLTEERSRVGQRLEASKERKKTIAQAHQKLSTLHSLHCWRPVLITENQIDILLLYDSVLMTLMLNGTSSPDQLITKAVVISRMKDGSEAWAELANRLTVDVLSACSQQLIHTFSTRGQLPQLLDEVSRIVSDIKSTCQEVKIAALKHRIRIHGRELTAEVWNTERLCKVSLSTEFPICGYPLNQLTWSTQVIMGDISDSQLQKAVMDCESRRQYITAVLDSVCALMQQ